MGPSKQKESAPSTQVGSIEEPITDDKPRSLRSSLSSSSSSIHSEDSIESIAAHNGRDPEKHFEKVEMGEALGKSKTGMSVATNATTDPAYEVDWDEDDPDNPLNWSFAYRAAIIAFVSFTTLSVVLYSTSYTAGIPGMKETFHIESTTTIVLGLTTYLMGLAFGSVILAPLSEMYGRRPIYVIAMAIFCLLIIPCALAPNLEAILITRFFGAFAGAAMIGNAPGTISDITKVEHLGMAFSIWSVGPMNGPVIGPLVGGFVFQYLGWRWTNWVVLICSGVAYIMIFSVKETYAPTILRNRAARLRKETGDNRYWSRYDEKKKFWPLVKLNLSRPFVMVVTEPILLFWDIYIGVIYAILYLCFVAYPIIFSEERGWAPGVTGLAYLGIGTGSMITIALEPLIRRMINAHKPDPTTGKPPPESMVSVVCIAAICIPVGELIFAWTCTPNVHWIAPILAGVPFGAGNCAVFIYASNYLVHSYGIYAASALAGNAVFRSVVGGTLPLAGPALYAKLGANWAGTLLGLLEVLLIPIPFVFYKYGERIRRKSALISSMQADKSRLEGKRAMNAEKMRMRGVTEEDVEGNTVGGGVVGEAAGVDVMRDDVTGGRKLVKEMV